MWRGGTLSGFVVTRWRSQTADHWLVPQAVIGAMKIRHHTKSDSPIDAQCFSTKSQLLLAYPWMNSFPFEAVRRMCFNFEFRVHRAILIHIHAIIGQAQRHFCQGLAPTLQAHDAGGKFAWCRSLIGTSNSAQSDGKLSP